MQKSSWQLALKHLSSGIDRYVGALSGADCQQNPPIYELNFLAPIVGKK